MSSEEDDFREWLNELIRELRKLQNALSRSGWALEGLENGAKVQRKNLPTFDFEDCPNSRARVRAEDRV